ncbi:endonuclease [Nocardiopsis ansamitocini]|uniref:Endonuclease n=1 Tax=Nocardiopsis ansamitocini TaxID=1670832 RepID=A0A9W6UHS9_9ACTN|nr:endonuclease [Nocardiopsis ansamitocini]
MYGGGGNSGATLRADFVELGNSGSTAAALDGWSVQYLPARPGANSTVQVTPLSGSVPAGGNYLVAQATGSGGSTDLPTPDATGTTTMSATQGIVALVAGTEPITCRTAADCAGHESIVDLIGWGDAAVYETAPAAATTNPVSTARSAAFGDTDDNSADFTAKEPTPVNSAGQTAGEEPGEEGPQEPGELRIHDIQGTTRVSPHAGRAVEGVPGIVTAINPFGSARGFWFQDPEPDRDPRTSEALFVFTGSTTPDVQSGDDVLVSGTVAEFRAGGATTPNQTVTQLNGAVWTVLSSGNALPDPVRLARHSVPERIAPEGADITGLTLDPKRYALDYWAANEHMLVSVTDARVVGATDAYNALWVTTKPRQSPSPRGGTVYGSYSTPNTGRLKIESLVPFAERPFPKANVGDELAGVTSGPLSYSQFGGYLIKATTLGEHIDNGLERESTAPQRDDELSVATYNVENLSPQDSDAKFDRLADGIVANLGSPDIIGLEEIQDNSGPTDDGTVAADMTLDRLAQAVKDAGGPGYHWREISPQDKADGGQPGGNIRNAFLFDPTRVEFTDIPGGDATTPVRVLGGGRDEVALSVSPGRISPIDEAWASSRKPLVGQFRFQDRSVFVVTNHFNSKGGDQPLHGISQPPVRSSETQRHAQARLVRDFTDSLLKADPSANVLVIGDLNDFRFSTTLTTLTQRRGLYAPIDDLPRKQRYNYVYDGNSQALDHILTSPALKNRVSYDIVRVNAEFHDQVSDHDPQIVRFRPLTGDPRIDAREDRIHHP